MDIDPLATSPSLEDSDFYDVLCVSRDSSAENIREAYFRLLPILDLDKQPPYLRQIAEEYFMAIQTSSKRFLTLIDGQNTT